MNNTNSTNMEDDCISMATTLSLNIPSNNDMMIDSGTTTSGHDDEYEYYYATAALDEQLQQQEHDHNDDAVRRRMTTTTMSRVRRSANAQEDSEHHTSAEDHDNYYDNGDADNGIRSRDTMIASSRRNNTTRTSRTVTKTPPTTFTNSDDSDASANNNMLLNDKVEAMQRQIRTLYGVIGTMIVLGTVFMIMIVVVVVFVVSSPSSSTSTTATAISSSLLAIKNSFSSLTSSLMTSVLKIHRSMRLPKHRQSNETVWNGKDLVTKMDERDFQKKKLRLLQQKTLESQEEQPKQSSTSKRVASGSSHRRRRTGSRSSTAIKKRRKTKQETQTKSSREQQPQITYHDMTSSDLMRLPPLSSTRRYGNNNDQRRRLQHHHHHKKNYYISPFFDDDPASLLLLSNDRSRKNNTIFSSSFMTTNHIALTVFTSSSSAATTNTRLFQQEPSFNDTHITISQSSGERQSKQVKHPWDNNKNIYKSINEYLHQQREQQRRRGESVESSWNHLPPSQKHQQRILQSFEEVSEEDMPSSPTDVSTIDEDEAEEVIGENGSFSAVSPSESDNVAGDGTTSNGSDSNNDGSDEGDDNSNINEQEATKSVVSSSSSNSDGSSNSECAVTFQLELTTDLKGSETSWTLMEVRSKTVLLNVTEGMYPDDMVKLYEYTTCLDSSEAGEIYSFTIYDKQGNGMSERGDTASEEGTPPGVYILSVDGQPLFAGTAEDFDYTRSHLIKVQTIEADPSYYNDEDTSSNEESSSSTVTTTLLEPTNYCADKPVLNPINKLSNYTFDGRVYELIMVMTSVSGTDFLMDTDSPRYKAACWILYDDLRQFRASDPLFLQRYVTALFYYSSEASQIDSVQQRFLESADECDYLFIQPRSIDYLPYPSSCNSNGELLKIEIAAQELQGPLVLELSFLSTLQMIRLPVNEMTGTIPKQLRELNDLETFDVQYNLLEGTIPSELGELTKLTTVVMDRNQFTGTLPSELFTGATDMVTLMVSDNLLEGTIPSELSNLTKLGVLNLQTNRFRGSIPADLFLKCTRLTKLRLHENLLTGTISTNIGNLIDLTELRLDDNAFTGSIPTEVGKLVKLEDASLSKNDFTTTLPSEVGLLTKLSGLGIRDIGLTGQIPGELGDLTQLIFLDARENSLEGSIPLNLWKISGVNRGTMDLRDNLLVGNVPDQVCDIINKYKIDLQVDCFEWLEPPQISCGCCHMCQNPSMLFVDEVYVVLDEEGGEGGGSMTSSRNRTLGVRDPPSSSSSSSSSSNTKPPPPKPSPSTTTTETSSSPSAPSSTSHEPEIICPGSKLEIVGDVYNYWELLDLNKVSGQKNKIVMTRIDEFREDDGQNLRHSLCISRTSCFSLRLLSAPGLAKPMIAPFRMIFDGITVYELKEPIFETQYEVPLVGYDQSSSQLQVDKCDAFDLCGIELVRGTSQREILNHLVELSEWSKDYMTIPSSARYQAACWLLTKDNQISNFDLKVEDGSAMQRYTLTLLHYLNDAWKLKNEINDHIYGTLDHYSSIPTCQWDGVACNNLGYVTSIDLSENTVVNGIIASELGYLTSLQVLRMNGEGRIEEKLRGTLPTQLGRLNKLEELDLGMHEIGGQLPNELLVQLHELKSLRLFSNRIEGTLSANVTQLQSLTHLDLSSNFLTGGIPESVEQLHTLQHLDLSDNNFEGPIPSFLSKLTQMKDLILSQNSLTSQIPLELFSLQELEQLKLHGNSLTGGIPTELGNLTNLTELTLSYNEFKGKIPQELTQLQQLKLLQVHGNALSGEAPDMMYIKQSYDDETGEQGQFVSDCGNPQETENLLSCPSCTICCNSEEECQVNTVRQYSMTMQTIFFMGSLWALLLSCTLLTVLVKRCRSKPLPPSRSHPRHLLGEESVYSFLLTNSTPAWIIFFATAGTQVAIYLMFLEPADFGSENSDWQYSMRCPVNDTQCEDDASVNYLGWLAFAFIMFASLGPDVINGARLMYKAIVLNSTRLWIGGMFHISMAALASWVSYFYNRAISASNSDLIVEAVILLFVNDIDERFLDMTMSVRPKWTKELDDQIDFTCEALDNFEDPLRSWRSNLSKNIKSLRRLGSVAGDGQSMAGDESLTKAGTAPMAMPPRGPPGGGSIGPSSRIGGGGGSTIGPSSRVGPPHPPPPGSYGGNMPMNHGHHGDEGSFVNMNGHHEEEYHETNGHNGSRRGLANHRQGSLVSQLTSSFGKIDPNSHNGSGGIRYSRVPPQEQRPPPPPHGHGDWDVDNGHDHDHYRHPPPPMGPQFDGGGGGRSIVSSGVPISSGVPVSSSGVPVSSPSRIPMSSGVPVSSGMPVTSPNRGERDRRGESTGTISPLDPQTLRRMQEQSMDMRLKGTRRASADGGGAATASIVSASSRPYTPSSRHHSIVSASSRYEQDQQQTIQQRGGRPIIRSNIPVGSGPGPMIRSSNIPVEPGMGPPAVQYQRVPPPPQLQPMPGPPRQQQPPDHMRATVRRNNQGPPSSSPKTDRRRQFQNMKR